MRLPLSGLPVPMPQRRQQEVDVVGRPRKKVLPNIRKFLLNASIIFLSNRTVLWVDGQSQSLFHRNAIAVLACGTPMFVQTLMSQLLVVFPTLLQRSFHRENFVRVVLVRGFVGLRLGGRDY